MSQTNLRSQSQMETLQNYRADKKYMTIRLSHFDYEKLQILCSNFASESNKKSGASVRSIITRLILDQHITSQVDNKAFCLFNMHTGLLKYSKSTFTYLQIDELLDVISRATNIILSQSVCVERKVNKLSEELDKISLKYKQTGIYLTSDEYTELTNKSHCLKMKKAEYIRYLIHKKQITSRFLISDIKIIDEFGTKIKQAIEEKSLENISSNIKMYKDFLKRILNLETEL